MRVEVWMRYQGGIISCALPLFGRLRPRDGRFVGSLAPAPDQIKLRGVNGRWVPLASTSLHFIQCSNVYINIIVATSIHGLTPKSVLLALPLKCYEYPIASRLYYFGNYTGRNIKADDKMSLYNRKTTLQ